MPLQLGRTINMLICICLLQWLLPLSVFALAAPPDLESPPRVPNMPQPIGTPRKTNGKSINSNTLEKLSLAAQYAAAVYCPKSGHHASDSQIIECSADTCEMLARDGMVLKLQINDDGIKGVHAYVGIHDTASKIVVAFRGSSKLQDKYLEHDPPQSSYYKLCTGCSLAKAPLDAWHDISSKVLKTLEKAVKTHPYLDIDVVGHSVGGALATIAAADLRMHGYKVDLYSFGSPQVGDKDFAEHMSTMDSQTWGKNYRVTHGEDSVSKHPESYKYQHIADEYFVSSRVAVQPQPRDVKYFESYEKLAYIGGNSATHNTALGFAEHSWIIRNLTSCSEDQYAEELDNWISKLQSKMAQHWKDT